MWAHMATLGLKSSNSTGNGEAAFITPTGKASQSGKAEGCLMGRDKLSLLWTVALVFQEPLSFFL